MRRRIVLALAMSAIATATSVFAASAAASGPAAPGKETIEVECAGLGSVTVSAPRSEHSKGVGQVVGQQGHGKPVSVTFTLTDVTTGTVLFSHQEHLGGEKAHSQQATTQCSAILAEVPAEVFFEGAPELPPGVEPTDLIRASFEPLIVVIKP
jgi:hypothetical protein